MIDCISRQAVLSMQYRIDDSATLSTRDVVSVDDIEDLPSVTPQPKTGHWIKSTGYDDRDRFYTCSECGRNINLICGAKLADYPYCHCGAKMGDVE